MPALQRVSYSVVVILAAAVGAPWLTPSRDKSCSAPLEPAAGRT